MRARDLAEPFPTVSLDADAMEAPRTMATERSPGHTQHHHRQPGRPVVQRLPRQPRPARRHLDRGLHRLVPRHVPLLLRVRPGPRCGRDGTGRTRGDPQRGAARALDDRAGRGDGRLRLPLGAAGRTLARRPARRRSARRGVQAAAGRVPGGGGVADPGVLRRPVHHGRCARRGRGRRASRRVRQRGGRRPLLPGGIRAAVGIGTALRDHRQHSV